MVQNLECLVLCPSSGQPCRAILAPELTGELSQGFVTVSKPSGQSCYLHSLPGIGPDSTCSLGRYLARLYILSAGFPAVAGSQEVLPREFLLGKGLHLSEESPNGRVLAATFWNLARERGALKVERESNVEKR